VHRHLGEAQRPMACRRRARDTAMTRALLLIAVAIAAVGPAKAGHYEYRSPGRLALLRYEVRLALPPYVVSGFSRTGAKEREPLRRAEPSDVPWPVHGR